MESTSEETVVPACAKEESMQQTMWESALEAEKVEHQLQAIVVRMSFLTAC